MAESTRKKISNKCKGKLRVRVSLKLDSDRIAPHKTIKSRFSFRRWALSHEVICVFVSVRAQQFERNSHKHDFSTNCLTFVGVRVPRAIDGIPANAKRQNCAFAVDAIFNLWLDAFAMHRIADDCLHQTPLASFVIDANGPRVAGQQLAGNWTATSSIFHFCFHDEQQFLVRCELEALAIIEIPTKNQFRIEHTCDTSTQWDGNSRAKMWNPSFGRCLPFLANRFYLFDILIVRSTSYCRHSPIWLRTNTRRDGAKITGSATNTQMPNVHLWIAVSGTSETASGVCEKHRKTSKVGRMLSLQSFARITLWFLPE